jgi:hypothetical protein
MTKTVTAYTDGACSGNPGAGAWEYRIEWPDGGIDEAAGGGQETTNNRALRGREVDPGINHFERASSGRPFLLLQG